jgi:hypothetical protein
MMDNMEFRWHFLYWKYHKHTCFINFHHVWHSTCFFLNIYIFLYIYIKTLRRRFAPDHFLKNALPRSRFPLPLPLRSHASATLGTTYNWYLLWKGRIQPYNWNSFKNDFLKRFQGILEFFFFQNSPDYNKKAT